MLIDSSGLAATPLPEPKLRPPRATDGLAVFELVRQSPPLDPNSLYCNLLQCSHFAATCVAAESEQRLVGFVSAYLRPDAPGTLFIWQVVVAEAARGQGLAPRMLADLLARPQVQSARFIETTITPANAASWRLFEKLAAALDAPLTKVEHFERDTHFGGTHESEWLVRVGPLARA